MHSPDSVFRALADPTRRALIERLAAGERSVGELAEPFAMSFAAISKHVGILEQSGIVDRRREGRERICTLRPEALLATRDWVERTVTAWTDRLDALAAAIAEDIEGEDDE